MLRRALLSRWWWLYYAFVAVACALYGASPSQWLLLVGVLDLLVVLAYVRWRIEGRGMKTDLPPTPLSPPRKRRVLRDANLTPDLYLAEWLDPRHVPPLRPHELRIVQEEKERRAKAKKAPVGVVGLVASLQGVTGAQTRAVVDVVRETPGLVCVLATQGLASHLVARGRRPPAMLRELLDLGLVVAIDPGRVLEESGQAVVRNSTFVVALPHEVRVPDNQQHVSEVWETVRYARHRKTPVTVIMPDGTIQAGGGTA